MSLPLTELLTELWYHDWFLDMIFVYSVELAEFYNTDMCNYNYRFKITGKSRKFKSLETFGITLTNFWCWVSEFFIHNFVLN